MYGCSYRMKKTLLIDSSCIGYQAFYSMGNLSHDGAPSGVVFGFLSRCLDLGHQFNTNRLVFCWDSPRSFRKELDPRYKENRNPRNPKNSKKKTEEERAMRAILNTQMDTLRENLLPRIGWGDQLLQEGLEGDDMLAIAADLGMDPSVIVTSDEDLFQCLVKKGSHYPEVTIWNPRKHLLWTSESFTKKYGILPQDWIEVKALGGCVSDNVIGVPGVKEKTAIKWITGVLPSHHQVFTAIEEFREDPQYQINNQLVLLPHPRTEAVGIFPSPELSLEALQEIAGEYGMRSLLSGDTLQRWADLFDGQFDSKTPRSSYNGVRGKTRDKMKERKKRKRKGFRL